MTAKKPTTKKTAKKPTVSATEGIMIGAGVAAAAAAGYFLFGPKGSQNRRKIQAWTLKVKAEVLEKIETLESVAEDKYYDIVDEVSRKYAQKTNIATDEVEKLATEMKKYWTKIQKDVAPKKKPAKKTTKKIL